MPITNKGCMTTYQFQTQVASAFAEYRTFVSGDTASIGYPDKQESALYYRGQMIGMRIVDKTYFSLNGIHTTALNNRLNAVADRLGYGKPFSMREDRSYYGPLRIDGHEMYDFDALKKFCPEGEGLQYKLMITDTDHIILVRGDERIGKSLVTPMTEAWRTRTVETV